MARKPLAKGGVSSTIASATQENNKLCRAAIFKVTPTGKINDSNPLSPMILNPETMEDTKTANWVENSIPGQSDPILQWTSSGPRVLSFTALVTKDANLRDTSRDPMSLLKDKAIAAVGNIASQFAGVNLPIAGLLGDLLNSPSKGEHLTIAQELDFYRSLLYPSIDEKGVLQSSPPLVVLALGKTLSASQTRNVKGPIGPKTDVWVTNSVNIRVTKWMPNLTPMEAEVSFQFTQYTLASRPSSLYDADSTAGPLGGKASDFLGNLKTT